MKVLIIGYGSIGKRHSDILANMGLEISLVTKRKDHPYPSYQTTKEALSNSSYDYIVISNSTHEHYTTMDHLKASGYDGLLMIEKPLFSNEVDNLDNMTFNAFVGYNLRFHPIIQDIKKLLIGQKIYSIQTYVGSYLPLWRPNTDYLKSYSAQKKFGGGALRDLSHELDYINWLTGGWKSVVAIGGTYSDLKIDSDDSYSLLLKTEKCPAVSIQLNYLDKIVKREIIINSSFASISADLISNTLKINGSVQEYKVEKNDTYKHLHQNLLNGNDESLCSFREAMDVMKLINASEKSAETEKWIHR
jgi:predicted dehydrogenase